MTSQCRMCLSALEDDMLHTLLCAHDIFNDYRNEVISLLQIKILSLLDEDMLPLCLLEWLLDEESVVIDGIPTNVMTSINTVGKRSAWFGFLPTMLIKWVRWKYESTK